MSFISRLPIVNKWFIIATININKIIAKLVRKIIQMIQKSLQMAYIGC